MIGWLLGPIGRWVGLGAVLALAGGGWWVAHTVSQWRAAYRERPALVAERDAAVAETAAMVESARLTGAVLGRAEERVAETGRTAAKVRVIYRDAVRTDQTCAEWARQPVGCPLGAPQ